MRKFKITRAEFQEFRELQERRRWDWPATFSTDPNGDVWPYVRNGYTPLAERHNVRGCSPILNEVVDIYSALREEGCRFFVGDVGALWKTQSKEIVQFIVWDFGGEELPQPKELTIGELFASVAERRRRDRHK